MRNEKLVSNYHKLGELERLSLAGRAILRDDQAELDQLIRSSPEQHIAVRHHFYVATAFDEMASAYLIDQLSRAARLYALMLPPADMRTRRMRIARGVAYEFFQHLQAWVEFSRWLTVPPDLAFALSPASQPIMRMAEKTARQLACSRRQACATARKDKSGKPMTVAQILAQWQQEFNLRVASHFDPQDDEDAEPDDEVPDESDDLPDEEAE